MRLDYREGPKPSFEEFCSLYELNIDFEYAVCSTCNGEGSHLDPGIDSNGITSSEMYELGEDFIEDYRSGRYDVSCNECNGLRVVKYPVFNNPNIEDIEDRWNDYVNDVYQYRKEIAMGY